METSVNLCMHEVVSLRVHLPVKHMLAAVIAISIFSGCAGVKVSSVAPKAHPFDRDVKRFRKKRAACCRPGRRVVHRGRSIMHEYTRPLRRPERRTAVVRIVRTLASGGPSRGRRRTAVEGWNESSTLTCKVLAKPMRCVRWKNAKPKSGITTILRYNKPLRICSRPGVTKDDRTRMETRRALLCSRWGSGRSAQAAR